MKKNANLNKTAIIDCLCSNYDKSMIGHSSDEDFYSSCDDEGGIRHFKE